MNTAPAQQSDQGSGTTQAAGGGAATVVEQIARMAAPDALQFLAQRIDTLESNVKTAVVGLENRHPVAAGAITTANKLLARLFPQEAGLVTDLEQIDL